MRNLFPTFHKLAALLATLLLFVSVSSATTHKSTKKPSARTSHTKHSTSKKRATSKKVRGQRAIDEQRAHQIQTALIREHYMTGEPTGQWDQRTKDAMQKYQAANGWQTKVVPDSRALIKLGLGPSKDNLINPETAATASVPASGPEPSTTAGGGSTFRQ